MEPSTPARAGSALDLSRRMDRIESRQDDQGRALAALSGTVERVELNQRHAEELNKLRFDALDASLSLHAGKLDNFMTKIDNILTGVTELPAAREGREMVSDYKIWRQGVDTTLTQTRLWGRIATVLASSGVLGALVAGWIAIHR